MLGCRGKPCGTVQSEIRVKDREECGERTLENKGDVMGLLFAFKQESNHSGILLLLLFSLFSFFAL